MDYFNCTRNVLRMYSWVQPNLKCTLVWVHLLTSTMSMSMLQVHKEICLSTWVCEYNAFCLHPTLIVGLGHCRSLKYAGNLQPATTHHHQVAGIQQLSSQGHRRSLIFHQWWHQPFIIFFFLQQLLLHPMVNLDAQPPALSPKPRRRQRMFAKP